MWLDKAKSLLHEYVTDERLLRHCYDVAKCVFFYAKKLGEDEDLWAATGLIHDFDYQMTQSTNPPDGHPYKGVKILGSLGFPEELIKAVLGHAEYTGQIRDTPLAKCLFACDELSGFIYSCSRVHPTKNILNLSVDFVTRRLKEPSFCRAVSRELLQIAADDFGVSLEEHIKNCIMAMSSIDLPNCSA